jgi:hypothetical protein
MFPVATKKESIASPVDLSFDYEIVKLNLISTLYVLFQEKNKIKPDSNIIKSIINQVIFDLKTIEIMKLIHHELNISNEDEYIFEAIKKKIPCIQSSFGLEIGDINQYFSTQN